jgi:hypothetical protein
MNAYRVAFGRLSGVDYFGETAARMYAVSAEIGFDEVSTSRHVFQQRGEKSLFTGYASPSGVSAHFQLAFETAEALNAWAENAKIVSPTEDQSTNLYRAILAAMQHAEVA